MQFQCRPVISARASFDHAADGYRFWYDSTLMDMILFAYAIKVCPGQSWMQVDHLFIKAFCRSLPSAHPPNK